MIYFNRKITTVIYIELITLQYGLKLGCIITPSLFSESMVDLYHISKTTSFIIMKHIYNTVAKKIYKGTTRSFSAGKNDPLLRKMLISIHQ